MKKSPSTKAACPEKKLLVCCARTELPVCVADQIREITASPLDWDFLIATAADNSVTPLLANRLLEAAANEIGASERARLQAAFRACAIRSLGLTQQLVRLNAALCQQGILAIPYKGPVLASQAYGDITMREFGDLDVILRHRDIAKAHEVMLELGYRARFPSALSPQGNSSVVPGEYNYKDESGRVVVDLHTERTLRHFPKQPNLEELASRLVTVEVVGHSIFTFALEDEFPILCIHGAKDFWQRIIWIADIAELIRSHPGLNWDLTVRRAESLSAGRMFRLGLALAQKLLDVVLPGEIATWVAQDAVVSSTACQIAQWHRSRQGARLGAAERFEFRRSMLSGTFDGLRYSIHLTAAPAEEDWSMMRLPRALSPFYFALRPLRLLRKYGWSAPARAGNGQYSDSSAKN